MYIGLFTATVAVIYGTYIIGLTVIFGNPVAGYPSLLVIILFLGGIQLLSLGIIGEYVGRIFNETKQRPLYIVDTVLPGRPEKSIIGSASAHISPEANEAVPYEPDSSQR
jgi:hypothetical protein